MKWSQGQLEALWATENPGNGSPHLMAAIAMAESAGDDQAVNSIGACGLWQIHPYEAGCQNPRTNARQAGAKLRSQGLGAWETYTNGSYRQFLSGGGGGGYQTIGTKIPGPLGLEFELPGNPFEGGPHLPSNIPNPFGSNPFSSLSGLAKILELISTKEGWIRIGKVLIGLFLLITGVLGMANIKAGEKIVRTGKRTAELGAAAGVL